MQVYQSTVFTRFEPRGYFRVPSVLQIIPVPGVEGRYHQDYPLHLQFAFDPRPYPDRPKQAWSRDVWEQQRYEHIRRRSVGEKMSPDDPWVKAYQQETTRFRPVAIVHEICSLLTALTKARFFVYRQFQGWGIGIDPDSNRFDKQARWTEHGYSPAFNGVIDGFTTPECPPMRLVPSSDYARRFRDTMGYDDGKELALPEFLGQLLLTYFTLDNERKIQFAECCQLYAQSIELRNTYPSLSFVAAAMAIERLIRGSVKASRCEDCGAPQPLEVCESCGMGIYRLSSEFRDFLRKYADPKHEKLFRQVYEERSKLAHGGLLRADLFDTGLYAGNKDDEDRLRRNALIVIHDAIMHWIIEIHNDQAAKTESLTKTKSSGQPPDAPDR